uniref:Uncharacterized protein n=1 Tax=Ixodes ricinus TaxID=34613 RepID=A0A6B0UWU7_IXORI
MMGHSLSPIITFEGTYVPYYVLYQQAEYRCRPHRPKAQICQRCHGIGHRADICANQTASPFICEKCSTYLEEQNQPHDCDPKCKNCGGPHSPLDPTCPTRVQANTAATQAAYWRRLRTRQDTTPHQQERRRSMTPRGRSRSRNPTRSRSRTPASRKQPL